MSLGKGYQQAAEYSLHTGGSVMRSIDCSGEIFQNYRIAIGNIGAGKTSDQLLPAI